MLGIGARGEWVCAVDGSHRSVPSTAADRNSLEGPSLYPYISKPQKIERKIEQEGKRDRERDSEHENPLYNGGHNDDGVAGTPKRRGPSRRR